MSRLIDADDLIEHIKKYKFGAITNDSEREYTREVMLCFVNGMPTKKDYAKAIDEFAEKICAYGTYDEFGNVIDVLEIAERMKGGAK